MGLFGKDQPERIELPELNGKYRRGQLLQCRVGGANRHVRDLQFLRIYPLVLPAGVSRPVRDVEQRTFARIQRAIRLHSAACKQDDVN